MQFHYLILLNFKFNKFLLKDLYQIRVNKYLIKM